MNQIVEVKFKKDKSKTPFSTYSKFKSQDINSVEFHLAFDGVELNESHKVTIHCKFKKSESVLTEVAEVVEGKATFKFDTRFITQKEEVHCSVYVSKGDQSIDVRTFVFEVELSEIDKGSLRVAEVYDANYQKLIADFQQQLFDYRDSLPQASELRAEIDVILNQFGMDSQAKLNQYDADAQQVIADNQTAFGLAESGRQDTYEQAEDNRNQSSNQAVADWEQGADAIVDSKLIEIQTDASTLINGAIDDFNMRGDAEIADWRVGADVELEDYLADRVVLKNLFPMKNFTAETYWVRSGVRLDFEIGSKYYASRDLLIVKGVANAVTGRVTDSSGLNFFISGQEYSNVITYAPTSGDGKNREIMVYGANRPDEFGESEVLFDNLTLIDLTATFGAGSEPTKSEMDELIKITGYIDGTLTLSLKQVAIWQLNLIRQNRTALIALGGTL